MTSVPTWVTLMEKIAESFFRSGLPVFKVLFVCAPLLFLRAHSDDTQVDLEARLLKLVQCRTIGELLQAGTEDVILQCDPRSAIDRAKKLFGKGQGKKALRILRGSTVPATADETWASVHKKVLFKETTSPIAPDPPSKSDSQATTALTYRSLRRAIFKIGAGKSPGTGMFRQEHLLPLMTTGNQNPFTLSMIVGIVDEILRGQVQDIENIIYHDAIIGIKEADSTRPICIGNIFVKLALSGPTKNLSHVAQQFGYGVPDGTRKVPIALQQHLFNNDLVIIILDCSNAFGSVNRHKFFSRLFEHGIDLKPLWRYLHGRYSRPSTYSVFGGGSYLGPHEANTGLNQGDTSSLLAFDFFVADFSAYMQNVALATYQIHDDTYIVVTKKRVEEALAQACQYFAAKDLTLNKEKCKIMSGTATTTCLPQVSWAKVGGVVISPHPAPPTFIVDDMVTDITAITQLPHQYALAMYRQCVVARLRYAVNAMHPRLAEFILPSIEQTQWELICRILRTSCIDAVVDFVDRRQLVERAKHGGLALYKYRDHRDSIIGGGGRQDQQQDQYAGSWWEEIGETLRRAYMTSRNVISVRPTQRSLELDDYDFSAHLGLLLRVWRPRPYVCRDVRYDPPPSPEGVEQYTRHAFCCQYCTSNLRTIRHDLVNDAIKTALVRNGILYTSEPTQWPLRTAPSRQGRDGPDGMLVYRNNVAWTDHSVRYHTNVSFLVDGFNYKKNSYKLAEECGLKVQPLCLSVFNAIEPRSLSFLMQLPKIALTSLLDHTACALARSTGLFMKLCSIRSSKMCPPNIQNNTPSNATPAREKSDVTSSSAAVHVNQDECSQLMPPPFPFFSDE
jgi:hypothetical protein